MDSNLSILNEVFFIHLHFFSLKFILWLRTPWKKSNLIFKKNYKMKNWKKNFLLHMIFIKCVAKRITHLFFYFPEKVGPSLRECPLKYKVNYDKQSVFILFFQSCHYLIMEKLQNLKFLTRFFFKFFSCQCVSWPQIAFMLHLRSNIWIFYRIDKWIERSHICYIFLL